MNNITTVIVIIACVTVLGRLLISDRASAKKELQKESNEAETISDKKNEQPVVQQKGITSQSAEFFRTMIDEGKKAFKQERESQNKGN